MALKKLKKKLKEPDNHSITEFHVYSDGSNSLTGCGGWGYIIYALNDIGLFEYARDYGGFTPSEMFPKISSNQMELFAAFKALQQLPKHHGQKCGDCGKWWFFVHYMNKPCETNGSTCPTFYAKKTGLRCRQKVFLYSDSKYVVNGMQNWRHGWQRNGWKNAQGNEVENQALWKGLIKQHNQIVPVWNWVKGHAGVVGNEEADQLAKEGRVAAQHFYDAGDEIPFEVPLTEEALWPDG